MPICLLDVKPVGIIYYTLLLFIGISGRESALKGPHTHPLFFLGGNRKSTVWVYGSRVGVWVGISGFAFSILESARHAHFSSLSHGSSSIRWNYRSKYAGIV